jgi:hypothetical protein
MICVLGVSSIDSSRIHFLHYSYLAASALRKHCNYIKDYYLSNIVSLIRIMFGELGWLTYLFAIRDVRISFIDAFF